VAVEKEHQQEKDKGQNIAGLHSGSLHQRPCGEKTFD
jgi:hypothetical protein